MLTQIMSVLDASKNLEVKQQQLNNLKQELQNLERIGKFINFFVRGIYKLLHLREGEHGNLY